MAVKIKLKRLGKIRNPQYRIVVADARVKRDGRAIEEIGLYHPKEEPSLIRVNSERAAYWLSVGAQPTEPGLAILKLTGDWQAYKGLPAPPPLRVAEPKPDKRLIFAVAAKEASDGKELAPATQARKKAAPAEAAPAVVEAPVVVEAPAVVKAPGTEAAPVVEAPAVEAPAAEAAPVVSEAVPDEAAANAASEG